MSLRSVELREIPLSAESNIDRNVYATLASKQRTRPTFGDWPVTEFDLAGKRGGGSAIATRARKVRRREEKTKGS